MCKDDLHLIGLGILLGLMAVAITKQVERLRRLESDVIWCKVYVDQHLEKEMKESINHATEKRQESESHL